MQLLLLFGRTPGWPDSALGNIGDWSRLVVDARGPFGTKRRPQRSGRCCRRHIKPATTRIHTARNRGQRDMEGERAGGKERRRDDAASHSTTIAWSVIVSQPPRLLLPVSLPLPASSSISRASRPFDVCPSVNLSLCHLCAGVLCKGHHIDPYALPFSVYGDGDIWLHRGIHSHAKLFLPFPLGFLSLYTDLLSSNNRNESQIVVAAAAAVVCLATSTTET